MNARDAITNMVAVVSSGTPYAVAGLPALLDQHRAESIAEFETYPGELAMLRGLLGVIRVVAKHGDMAEVRRLLAEHASDEQAAYAEEKDTAAAQQLARFEDARHTLQQTREQGGAR
ncbi:hypothetical protein OG508_28250 [Streptomyces sp. NBC_01108]|uniref:hypothetical protein n=1 Tax=Streptomyces sp. NBC_01108 TaxID=2903751 RepID=UPI003873C93A|nr:hypothetical protein OG508_28250 [Streptomyces sp. NBC_01108]